ncbi:MAG: hypothetical protein K2L76_01640 [Muribaculaceae bacterium]|nr:hypothetical protein [Muribaculaceae bacterium]
MVQAEITWWAIVAVLLLAFIFRAFERYYTECRPAAGDKPRRSLFEEGEEGQMLYVPGDLSDEDAELFDNL